jgi:type II secretory pathway component GspD/PulD (secretin)
VAATLALSALAPPGAVRAAERQDSPCRRDPATLERGIAELGRRLASLVQQVEEKCRESQAPRQLAVFRLKRIGAERMARKLKALLGEDPDIEYITDEPSNTLFLRASPDRIRQAREIIQRLDVPSPSCIYIIPLRYMDATKAAEKLRALQTDEDEMHITADGRGNNILITASKERVRQAWEVLRRLDVKPE